LPSYPPHPVKDDRLDALAIAVAWWSKALSVETEKVVQRKREEMMQAGKM
jgi:hypothetical protein